MASNAQDTLYNFFSKLFGGQGIDLGDALQTAEGAFGDDMRAEGGGIGAIATTVLKSAFGVIPLIGGFLGGLFGGEDSSPPPLVKYEMPDPIAFEAADTASGLAMVDYDPSGLPRSIAAAQEPGIQSASQAWQPATPGTTGPVTAAPQINVTVQAMDARSFLDRSSDIAAAVREAMLNLSSINDVVNDL